MSNQGRADRSDSSSVGSIAEAVFAPKGEYWTVGYRDRTFSFKTSKGLSYIHRLLQHPGEEFHCLDLLSEADSAFAPKSDSGEMPDDKAKRDYKRRLLELHSELEDARAADDCERAEQIESDLDSLMRETSRTMGIGGRDPRAGSAAERARLNVTRAIRAAVQKIAEHDAGLAKWLDHSIRTGSFCSFIADNTARLKWKLSFDDHRSGAKPAASAPLPFKPQSSLLQVKTDRTRFVGRDAELGKLTQYLDLARAGRGSITIIAGAPGIGKTRLAGEIGAEASRRGFVTLAGACYDRDDSVPFIPFVEILESAQAQSPSEEAFRRAIGDDTGELSRLMPQLRRTFDDVPTLGDVSPEQSRRLLLTAFVDFLNRTAGNAPLLLVIDDLQWGDEGTFSLLSHIARFVSEIPILIVGTYRDSEFTQSPGLAATIYACTRLNVLRQINLTNLSKSATAEMTAALCHRVPPQEIADLFYSGSEGNPFFVEELFRHLMERGNLVDSDGQFHRGLKLDRLDVPRNVRLIIDRRLARLGAETRKMLDTAAVIGRSFTFELLEAATEIGTDQLLNFVEEAEALGLISSTFEFPHARLQFSHDLIRQSVLADLSVPRRQRLHLRIADTIECLNSQTPAAEINDLAYHLWQAGSAGEPLKAIGYLRTAAQRARDQSAYEAAIAHLTNALDLLRQMPDDAPRAELELELSLELLEVLRITNRWMTSEARTVYARARELSERLGQSVRMYRLLQGTAQLHLSRSELNLAEDYAHRILELAEHSAKPGWAVSANYLLGHARCCRGDFIEAHNRLSKAVELQSAMPASRNSGIRGRALSLCIDSTALWMLGYPDQSLASANEGVEATRQCDNPYDLTFALAQFHELLRFRRDYSSALEIADGAIRLAAEHKFEWLETYLRWSRDACRALAGLDDKIEPIRSAFNACFAAQLKLYRLSNCTALAECCGALNQAGLGLSMIDQTFSVMAEADERMTEPEMWRVKGELLLQLASEGARSKEAEEYFLKAIAIAHTQNAKIWELRATASLARLLEGSNRKAEARDRLSEIYGWFTEGFDTPDLQQARAILERISS